MTEAEDFLVDDSSTMMEEEILEVVPQATFPQREGNLLSHLLHLWGLDSEPFPLAYEGWWDITVRNFEERR